MSYAIYKTQAIILRSSSSGEANKDVVFLTRDLGKITARAQAARKIESKMRMHLGRYNHVVIDIVRGKNIWRLTGISTMIDHSVLDNNDIVSLFARSTFLAEHLIRGEESHPELFDFFVGFLLWLSEHAEKQENDCSIQSNFSKVFESISNSLELFLAIHVLTRLGYWSGELLPNLPDQGILEKLSNQRKQLTFQINKAIEATQIS